MDRARALIAMNGQLDLAGRECAPEAAPPGACEAPRLFDAPQTIRGQMAMEAPVQLNRRQLRAVACPVCRAGVGSPCRRPSGHTVFGGDVHADRRELARQIAEPVPVVFELVQEEPGRPLLGWIAILAGVETITFGSPAEAEDCARYHA